MTLSASKLAASPGTKCKAPAAKRGPNCRVCPCKSVAKDLLLSRLGLGGLVLGILAAETLYAAGGIHHFLLAGEEGMASGADFNADIAFVGGAG